MVYVDDIYTNMAVTADDSFSLVTVSKQTQGLPLRGLSRQQPDATGSARTGCAMAATASATTSGHAHRRTSAVAPDYQQRLKKIGYVTATGVNGYATINKVVGSYYLPRALYVGAGGGGTPAGRTPSTRVRAGGGAGDGGLERQPAHFTCVAMKIIAAGRQLQMSGAGSTGKTQDHRRRGNAHINYAAGISADICGRRRQATDLTAMAPTTSVIETAPVAAVAVAARCHLPVAGGSGRESSGWQRFRTGGWAVALTRTRRA